MNTHLTGLIVGLMITTSASGIFAADSHLNEAITHAEAASKGSDGKAVAEHAEAAQQHAKIADEHLDAGLKSLEGAIEHGKLGHSDKAKKAAEEAVTHLKAAQ
jgi:hypothetical protein